MAKKNKGASPTKGFEPSIRDQVAQNHLQLRAKFFAYDKAVKATSTAGNLDTFTLRVNRQGEVSSSERARFTAQLELLLGSVQIKKKADDEAKAQEVEMANRMISNQKMRFNTISPDRNVSKTKKYVSSLGRKNLRNCETNVVQFKTISQTHKKVTSLAATRP